MECSNVKKLSGVLLNGCFESSPTVPQSGFRNTTRTVHSHLAKRKEWDQICSALDTLDDTALAMDAYWRVPLEESSQNDGSAYLYIYGLIQAMFVQQGAIMALAKCFELKIDVEKEYAFMTQIREHRNWAVGHPTNPTHGPHTISRPNLSRNSFILVSHSLPIGLTQQISTENICSEQFREGKHALDRIAAFIVGKSFG